MNDDHDRREWLELLLFPFNFIRMICVMFWKEFLFTLAVILIIAVFGR